MQYLINKLNKPVGKNRVEELAKIIAGDSLSIAELIEYSFHKDQQIGFRAAWILEQVYLHYETVFLPSANGFLDCLQLQHNQSALRCYVKILALMTGKKSSPEIKEIIITYPTDKIVEVVFAWIIDPKIPVAIKSHCISILANLTVKHDWIKNELIQTMNFLVDKESIAFFAKVKQIRKQLK